MSLETLDEFNTFYLLPHLIVYYIYILIKYTLLIYALYQAVKCLGIFVAAVVGSALVIAASCYSDGSLSFFWGGKQVW